MRMNVNSDVVGIDLSRDDLAERVGRWATSDMPCLEPERHSLAIAGYLAADVVLDFVEQYFGEASAAEFIVAMRAALARREEMA